MPTIEIKTQIDPSGNVHVPERYRHLYGRAALLVVPVPDEPAPPTKTMDPMQYSGSLDWPVDGLEYQAQCRDEWPSKRRQPGSAKGILRVLAEDDKHLEAFRDYMP